jgi:acyl-CoA synthetase (NDP forming)
MSNTAVRRHRARLAPLLEPRSIAVVGASDRPGPARNVVSNLLALGFDGELYLINPKRKVVAGRPALPSLRSLPRPCDLMVAAVNRDATVEVVEEAVELGVCAGVLLAAGFAESGEEGARLQARLAAVADRIALLGPNCLGFVNLDAGVAPYSGPPINQPKVGNVALVSNSGALACTITGAAAERGLLFRYVITTGNQVGLSTADFVRYLAAKPGVEVVACCIEGFRDGRDLLAAFSQARAEGKQLVVLKAGRTKAGGEAARTHTGALSGSSGLQESLFGESGVLMAREIEEFLAIIELQARLGRRLHGGVGVLTISGGERLLMADASEEAGLRLAVLSDQTEKDLRAALPSFAAVSNPLDTTGAGIVEGDLVVHSEAARLLAADPGVDILLACQDSKNGWLESEGFSRMFLDAVEAAHRAALQAKKPLVVVSPTSGSINSLARRYLVDNDIPFLAGLVPSIAALAKTLDHTAPEKAAHRPLRSLTDQGSRLSGAESFARLREGGVEPWPYRVATSEDEAVNAASRFGYPVALKLDAPIPHRSEVDGVRLALGDQSSVRAAFRELTTIAGALGFTVDGILIQPMAPRGLEVFIGGINDPQFGPVLLVGPGGSHVEDLATFAAALAPVGAGGAKSLLERAPLRWPPALLDEKGENPTRLSLMISELSQLIADKDVAVFDVNPLIVHAGGLAVIDAKIVLRAGPPT